MSGWLQWIILAGLTGSPLGAAIFLVLFWSVVDRFTFGVLPDPLRPLMRWQRRLRVEKTLAQNPHDGRARLELAQLYIESGRGKAAVEVLRPTFDAGADDLHSVFTMGVACLQAGFVEQGEKLLAHAEELDRNFRMGELFLVRGRYRLARGDFAGAKTELETFVKLRSGTVQGRTLLARAHAGLGDDATAALLRDEAWREFTLAPRFQRRLERFWAWRAKPSRPATYLLIIALVFGVFATVAPKLEPISSYDDQDVALDLGPDEE